VLNVVHGTHDTVNRILDHPDIAAVSFVGSGVLGLEQCRGEVGSLLAGGLLASGLLAACCTWNTT